MCLPDLPRMKCHILDWSLSLNRFLCLPWFPRPSLTSLLGHGSLMCQPRLGTLGVGYLWCVHACVYVCACVCVCFKVAVWFCSELTRVPEVIRTSTSEETTGKGFGALRLLWLIAKIRRVLSHSYSNCACSLCVCVCVCAGGAGVTWTIVSNVFLCVTVCVCVCVWVCVCFYKTLLRVKKLVTHQPHKLSPGLSKQMFPWATDS